MIDVIESDAPTKAGFYRMNAEKYHADPCVLPSLSSSLVKLLSAKSPQHCWYAHPRLNPDFGAEEVTPQQEAARDFGSATHKLTLGFGADIEIVQANDWRTAAAKEARDKARLNHRIPLLQKTFDEAEAVAQPLRYAMEDYLGIPMEKALREVVLVWKEGKFWRRAMLDAMTPNLLKIADAKSTATSCAPASVCKFLYTQGYHVSAAFYLRGLDALDPDNMGRRSFAFQFIEKKAPYATSPTVELSEAGRALGEKICNSAAFTWDACLQAGTDPQHWRGYEVGPIIAEPPAWLLTNTMMEWETE